MLNGAWCIAYVSMEANLCSCDNGFNWKIVKKRYKEIQETRK